MSKKYNFDYLIIGSGPAGTAAATTLAKSKKRVGIVEGRFFGGAFLNTRDVPTSTALDFSHHFHHISSYPELQNQVFHFNYPTISARELKTVIEAGGNNKKVYEDAKITCIKGFANFLDKHTIAVGDKKITSANFILATGSHLKVLEISGTNSVGYHTPETAIKLRRLPKVIAIVGAGAAGCELACFFGELGAKTILLETAERILPHEDTEVSEVISEYLTQKLGVTILSNSRVVALEQDTLSKRVIFRNENTEKLVRVDTVVLATGSQPNLDYGLENAGIKYKNSGITVDKFFATSTKHIYAIGDALGDESSTDRAHAQGLTLANNLTSRSKNPLNYAGFIRTIKTTPEVAVVGLDEEDLLKRYRKYKKSLIKLDQTIASKIYNFDTGFVKLLADKNNRIIGATIVAPNASILIQEIALAVRHNLTAIELASTPHSMDSYNYAIKLAAKELLNKK